MEIDAMWIISLVIFTSIHGLLGLDIKCMENKYMFCGHLSPKEDMDEVGFPPNNKELKELCPKVLKYYKCLKDYHEMCKFHYDTTSDTIISTSTVVLEVCNEGSRLHTAYTQSSHCFKSLVNTSIGLECEGSAEVIYNAYLLDKNEYGDIEDWDRTHHRYCMEKSYKMACIALRVFQRCGETALSTFLELIHRSKYLTPICTVETIQELNDEFLEFLDVDAEQRTVFRRAFKIQMQ